MAESHPTPARLSEVAGRVTFCLRTYAGEVIDLGPTLQEIFREELARIWEAAFRGSPGGPQ